MGGRWTWAVKTGDPFEGGRSSGSGSLRRRANGSLRDRANGSLRDRFLQKAYRACMRVDMFTWRCMCIYAHARAGMRLFVLVGVYIA